MEGSTEGGKAPQQDGADRGPPPGKARQDRQRAGYLAPCTACKYRLGFRGNVIEVIGYAWEAFCTWRIDSAKRAYMRWTTIIERRFV